MKRLNTNHSISGKIKDLIIPKFIDCKRNYEDKGIDRTPSIIYFDTCCFFDIIHFRHCKQDGYPLWYAPTLLLDDTIKGKYKGIINENSISFAVNMISQWAEEKPSREEEGIARTKDLLKYYDIFTITKREKSIIESCLDFVKKYHLSIEDSMQLKYALNENADTMVTRDIKLLSNVELRKYIQIVRPETIVGTPPTSLYIKKDILLQLPEKKMELLKSVIKTKDAKYY